MKTRHILLFTSLMMAAAACGTQRQVGGEVPAMEKGHTVHADKDKEAIGLRFMQRVADNALYQKNLVSNLTFTLERNGNAISVPGILRMRKDNVIRLQLLIPVLRSEVGRIEFTPEGVLFVDRYHHQYVKTTYDEVTTASRSTPSSRSSGTNCCSLENSAWERRSSADSHQR